MSWLGLRDQKGAVFGSEGVGQQAKGRKSPNTRLTQGTFLMEFAAIPGETDQVLFSYASDGPVSTVFEVRLTLDGDLTVHSEGIGYSRFHKLEAGFITRSSGIVLKLTWDAERDQHALSMEVTESGALHFRPLAQHDAMVLRDAVLMFLGKKPAKMGAGVRFVALADHVMAHGPVPTLHPSTKIPTLLGRRPISDLKVGDVVLAADGSRAQVRWACMATLPALGRFAPRRICAPFHNARTDMICAHDQLLRLGGSEVEYLFATNHVLSKTGDLAHGVIAEQGDRYRTVDYAQIVLDRPVAMEVSGLMVEPLNLLQLQENPTLKPFSTLSSLPAALWPTPSPLAPEILQPFEVDAWSKIQAA